MGCDGGTIPKRHELVKTAKRGEQKDKDMERSAKWTSCTITQQTLTTPIVLCELGRMYSKESMLEYILDRTISDACSHVSSMKQVKELKLTPNPGYSTTQSAECHDQYFDTQRSLYVCPIVGTEMNGKYRFCALWGCGCVLSERALKEVDTDTCHNCGAPFHPDDVIIINPDDDDLEVLQTNMVARRERIKAARKEKKAKKSAKQSVTTDEEEAGTSASSSSSSVGKRFIPLDIGSKKSRKSTDTEEEKEDHVFEMPTKIPKKSLDSDVTTSKKLLKKTVDSEGSKKSKSDKKVEQDGSKKSDKSDGSKKTKSDKKSRKEGEGSTSSTDANERLDPKQSSVYKKLFTSGVAGNGKDKTAHWVTYNPYHL